MQRAMARAAVDRERFLVRLRADIESEVRLAQSKSNGAVSNGSEATKEKAKELNEPRGATLMI